MEHVQAVGIGEFRANLHKYTSGSTSPIAVTSHGRTVGYYIPVSPPIPSKEVLDRLVEASRNMSASLLQEGVTEEKMVAEFERLRKQGKKAK